MFRKDIFDDLNHVMANMDVFFRDAEEKLGMGNLLPHVTTPACKTYYTDQRAVDDGEKITYYRNGRVSRIDGPAVEYHDKEKGQDEWWLEGKLVTKELVEEEKEKIEAKRIHYLSIDGKTYNVTGDKIKIIKELLK